MPHKIDYDMFSPINRQEASPHIAPKSIDTDSLSMNPAEGVPQSVYAALSQGHAVALVPGRGVKSVDPADFSTDNAALQALVNWIEANFETGEIYAPVVTSDGTELTIEDTVALDNSSVTPVSFFFIGGGQSQGPSGTQAIRTTINDGSVMFDLLGDTVNGNSMGHVRFEGAYWNLEDQDATIVRTAYSDHPWIRLGRVDRFIGDAVVFDSSCYNYRLAETMFTPKDGQTPPTARCVVTKDSYTTVSSDGVIGPHCSAEKKHHTSIANDGGHTRLIINGHWEGAAGRASIDCAAGGYTTITPATNLEVTNSGAHGIYVDSGGATIAPSSIAQTADDGIHIGSSPSEFHIWDQIRFNSNITGDAIHVEGVVGGSNITTVPYENSVRGSVVYPSEPWSSLYYPDGWRKSRSGTTTVTASSTATATAFAGNNNNPKRVEITHASAPAGDTTYRYYFGVDASNNHTTLELENLGSNDVDLSWRILTR